MTSRRPRLRDHRHLGLHEIADMFGVTRQAVQKWIAKPDADFPPPADRLKGQDVWHEDDIVRWAQARGREVRGLNPPGDVSDQKSRRPRR